MSERPTNWAGNVTFTAELIHRPSTVEQLQQLVAGHDRVSALGSAHSFNAIADTPGALISLADLPPSIDIDPVASTVTVGGGVRYGVLAQHLQRAGFALPNMGSLPHITIAGACSTGTHGSGTATGNLASAVVGLELVGADGELVRVTRADEPNFDGMVVGLGALGIAVRLTLAIVATYDIRQWVYDDLPMAGVLADFDAVFASAYSVSLFTDWQQPSFTQAWLKSRDGGQWPVSWRGGRLADGPRHPVPGMSAEHCTEQGGVPGPWNERLPHFRLDFTPSAGAELQTEYLLPLRHAPAAVRAVAGLADVVAPVLQISEIRTVAADQLWLSPSYQRDTVAVHFTWVDDTEAVLPVVRAVEAALAPFEARPHWGKVFELAPDTVATGYVRLPDFRRVVEQRDPTGKFTNDMIERFVRPGPAADG